jgi:transcription initiation factor IIE alpha subunit
MDIYCGGCVKALDKKYFPICTACDDMIKSGKRNLDNSNNFICVNHADNYKFDYDNTRIYLCERCIPRFERYDRGLLRCIDYELSLLDKNQTSK